nr:hypothetical protein [Anaplasma phagocytophilum]
MMLLLDRLMSFLLLLPRLLGRTSFSLLRLLVFLILRSMTRFVRRRQHRAARLSLVSIQRLRKVILMALELHCVVVRRMGPVRAQAGRQEAQVRRF